MRREGLPEYSYCLIKTLYYLKSISQVGWQCPVTVLIKDWQAMNIEGRRNLSITFLCWEYTGSVCSDWSFFKCTKNILKSLLPPFKDKDQVICLTSGKVTWPKLSQLIHASGVFYLSSTSLVRYSSLFCTSLVRNSSWKKNSFSLLTDWIIM